MNELTHSAKAVRKKDSGKRSHSADRKGEQRRRRGGEASALTVIVMSLKGSIIARRAGGGGRGGGSENLPFIPEGGQRGT